MEISISKLFLSLLFAWGLTSMAIAQPLPLASSLAAQLKAEDDYIECWDSLMELQACAGEVILFFLNGETYLGPCCCRALSVIQRRCWPTMLGSLGFTAQEGDILRGYCDAYASMPPPAMSPNRMGHGPSHSGNGGTLGSKGPVH